MKATLLLAGVACFIATALAAAPAVRGSEAHGDALRVMSFNIRADFDAGETTSRPNAWLATNGKHRRDRVIATIREYDPDLLGVQEAFVHQQRAIADALTDHDTYGVGRDDGQSAGEHSTIFYRRSRFKKTKAGTYWLCPTPDEPGSLHPDAACSRIASWVLLQDQQANKLLLVINTHWDHVGKSAREFSADRIRSQVEQQSVATPVIVMGDLNANEESEAYKAILGARTVRPLVDSYRFLHPEREVNEATFHGFKLHRRGMRIDYILHTNSLVAAEAAIVRQQRDAPSVSDHYPVTAGLAYGSQAEQ